MLKSITFSLLSLFLMVSCHKSSKKATSNVPSQEDILRDYATQKLGEDYQVRFNKTNEYAVISTVHKIKPSDPLPTIRFEILQVNPLDSIFADIVPGGTVTWVDDYIIEVVSKIGAPPKSDEEAGPKTYRYHVQNKKKYSGSFIKKE